LCKSQPKYSKKKKIFKINLFFFLLDIFLLKKH
jgi:hypothetical protein